MTYYSEHSEEYIESTIGIDMSYAYSMLEPLLPRGGSLLDVGFGSGRDMLYFKSKGFVVSGIDVEPHFVEHAKQLGLNVRLCDVRNLEETNRYDGIWANACLLHLKRSELKETIKKLLSLLKPNGYLYLSMKKGDKEIIDERGRPMLFVEPSFFDEFHVKEMKETFEERRGITWINLVLSPR